MFYHKVAPEQFVWDLQMEKDLQAQEDQISVMATPGAGNVSCTVGSSKTTCKWQVTLSNDKINYSNVKLQYDKRPSF